VPILTVDSRLGLLHCSASLLRGQVFRFSGAVFHPPTALCGAHSRIFPRHRICLLAKYYQLPVYSSRNFLAMGMQDVRAVPAAFFPIAFLMGKQKK